jgi:hypothetical protein
MPEQCLDKPMLAESHSIVKGITPLVVFVVDTAPAYRSLSTLRKQLFNDRQALVRQSHDSLDKRRSPSAISHASASTSLAEGLNGGGNV